MPMSNRQPCKPFKLANISASKKLLDKNLTFPVTAGDISWTFAKLERFSDETFLRKKFNLFGYGRDSGRRRREAVCLDPSAATDG